MTCLRIFLEDQNIKTQKASYLYAQQLVDRKIKEKKLKLSRGRKLFIDFKHLIIVSTSIHVAISDCLLQIE